MGYEKPSKFQETILKDLKYYLPHGIYNTKKIKGLKMDLKGLPFEEEILIKNANDLIQKVKIGSLGQSWEDIKVLSIKKGGNNFGSFLFTPVKNVSKNITSYLLEITLSDGRQIISSPDLDFPKMRIHIRASVYDSPDNSWSISYSKAKELKKGDNLLVFHKIPFSSNVSSCIFLPSFLNWENQWVGIRRDEYLKFSYQKTQRTENPLIKLINSKFQYSKSAKIYRTLWSNLSNRERKLLEREVRKKHIDLLIKIHSRVGRWYQSLIQLSDDFFRYLGWYVSEGSLEKNRVNISQSKEKHLKNWQEIIQLCEKLNFPYSIQGKKTIRINSNVIMELTKNLCSKLAQNKTIPFELFNKNRTNAFLEAYFKGDGCLKTERFRKYITASKELKNNLVSLLGCIGEYCSIWNPKHLDSDNCYRIVETEGKKYKRKYMGLLDFNSTTPVKIKSIIKIKEKKDIINLITENGCFVSTNGILVSKNQKFNQKKED